MSNPIFLIFFSFTPILLGLMIVRRLWKSYPLFFGYFATVVGRDIFFLIIYNRVIRPYSDKYVTQLNPSSTC